MPTIRFLAFLVVGAIWIWPCGCTKSAPPGGGRTTADWLIDPSPYRAEVRIEKDGSGVALENGLVRRELRLRPNAATVGLRNLTTEEEFIRAVRPEARLTVNGRAYDVGGLRGQVEQAYLLREWLAGMTADPGAFQLRSYVAGKIGARFSWGRKRYAANTAWPPEGIRLRLDFDPPSGQGLEGVTVSVLYELYDGLPLVSKSIIVRNAGPRPVTLDAFVGEMLAVVEPEAAVNTPAAWSRPNLHVESDMAFLADNPRTAAKTTFWMLDPSYTSQVNYRLQTPCLLESRPPLGPAERLEPGETFESFRTHLLVHDGADRERRGLALRRMYRTLAPWVTENPVMMHLRSTDPAVVKAAVDQCADTGFEMLILSFGSGLDMENEDPAYRRALKDLADYAHSRGIEIGGYSLLASRRIGDADDVIDPRTGRPGGAAFGNSPCLGSRWGQDYFRKVKGFFEATGFDLLEHDGSYPGDVCASTDHPGHRGLADSQWSQWRTIADFYNWCRGRGIYLNVPDWYFLSGSNKTAMGYREVNWSLPRDRQVILGRQNIFDGTWEKAPSMGWMFVPLVEYQGGGGEATIEPLDEHLEHYEAHLAQNFSAGVQACYRGVRLYDTERTRAAVKTWVDFYKTYRDILDSDIIHVRRPDGRDLDGILHVNPGLVTKGLAVVYNPTDRGIARAWTLPLYYTGLVGRALIREKEGPPSLHPLDRFGRTDIGVRLAPRSMTWFLISAADDTGLD